MARVPVVRSVMAGRNISLGRTWLAVAKKNPNPACRALRAMLTLLRFYEERKWSMENVGELFC